MKALACVTQSGHTQSLQTQALEWFVRDPVRPSDLVTVQRVPALVSGDDHGGDGDDDDN